MGCSFFTYSDDAIIRFSGDSSGRLVKCTRDFKQLKFLPARTFRFITDLRDQATLGSYRNA